ncbi:MAG: hypothetical protein ACN6PM_23850 [Achromobacter mucicolens]|uniref:hypothetical protein n=1 Tax=Achromobacter mucicolens TaxID=1389922 RepID=UPI003D0FD398
MRTVKKSGQSRPSFDEIQSKWRLFRFASTLLPALPDTQEPAAIVATRLNDHCVEVVSNTLQTEGAGFLLRLFTFFGLLSFFLAVFGVLGGWSAGVLILSLGLPCMGLIWFFLPCLLAPRYRYRCSKVRFDRRSRRVYYVPYPEESSDAIWELEWDRLQGISWSTGQAQAYLYLVGYTCNLPESQLVKIPIMFNEKIFASHIWAWLHGFMDKVEALPAPKIIAFPQNSRDVLMRYGGRWITWSLTTKKGRLWLPLMIWVDLAILLIFMPVLALPQLIVLLYPEIRFTEENDRHCGFSAD